MKEHVAIAATRASSHTPLKTNKRFTNKNRLLKAYTLVERDTACFGLGDRFDLAFFPSNAALLASCRRLWTEFSSTSILLINRLANALELGHEDTGKFIKTLSNFIVVYCIVLLSILKLTFIINVWTISKLFLDLEVHSIYR